MSFIKRIIVSFLALLMFSTSACFAVDTHICGDEVQSIAFFSKAESCEMMAKRLKEENKELPPCCQKLEDQKENYSNSKTNIGKKPCCYNESQSFKKDLSEDGETGVFVLASLDLDLPQHFEIVLSNSIKKERVNYSPPPDPDLKRNILVLHQVFII